MPAKGKAPLPRSKRHDKVDPRVLFGRDPKQAEDDDYSKRAPRKGTPKKRK